MVSASEYNIVALLRGTMRLRRAPFTSGCRKVNDFVYIMGEGAGCLM
jgi:hypothetical protein